MKQVEFMIGNSLMVKVFFLNFRTIQNSCFYEGLKFIFTQSVVSLLHNDRMNKLLR